MQSSRYTMGAVLVVGALVATTTALVYPVMTGLQAAGTSPDVQTVSTQYGPLTKDDRDFVVKVRLAGLWESPAGHLAIQKGTTEAFKTAGKHLIDGHAGLDASCREIAPQLGITLPNKPTPQQQGFVATLTAANGREFDVQLANILRVTHGQIFSSIAKERAATKNTLIRQLADQANDTVLDHMTVLEKTGYVNIDQDVPQITASPTLNPKATIPPSPGPGDPVLRLSTTPGATNAPPAPQIGEPATGPQ
jgi:predicted outer membrane protein